MRPAPRHNTGTGKNWEDLVKLWNRESSWLWYAENKSSGAYGIPQSLPGSKMAQFGENWKEDAAVQIDWGSTTSPRIRSTAVRARRGPT